MGVSRLLVNKTKNEIFYYGCSDRYDIKKIKEVLSLGWDKDDEIYFRRFNCGCDENLEFEIGVFNNKLVLLITDNINNLDIKELKEKYKIDKNNNTPDNELTANHLIHFKNNKFIKSYDLDSRDLIIQNLDGYIIWSKVE